MLAIGAPGEANAQDASSAYGKLVELEVFNPNAVASVPDPTTIPLLPRIIGDGIQQPGGLSYDGGIAVLADRGSSLQHELTAFRPEWRPLDFGWPFYEGSASTRPNPPAAVNGPMVSALGIRVNLYYAAVFGIGSALAGAAGALAAPVRSLTPGMGFSILIESFIVTVIGGMGSIVGAFVAALLIGFTRSFGSIGFPLFVDGVMFLFMALVLIFKPSGLFGRPHR